jgi:hypothetical protein
MSELTVKTGVDASGFETGLNRLQGSVRSFATAAGGILAGAFAFDKLMSGLNAAIQKGDQLQDLANRFGVSANALQEIGNAASLSGASLEDVASAMNKLARNAGEAVGGNKQLEESFARIGVSVADLSSMSPQSLFFALSQAVASGTLGMEDFAVAQDLAGRGAAILMETFRMGKDQIIANGQAMGTWSNETIAALSQASDEIKKLDNIITRAFGGVAQFLTPALRVFEMIAQEVGFASAALGQFFKGNFSEGMAIAAAAKKARSEFFNDEKNPATSAGVRNVDGGARAQSSSSEFREKLDVAEARQELRVMEAGIAGAAAAERVLANFTPDAVAGPDQTAQAAERKSSMEVLADSLQQVGGGGRFAQIGGADATQRDQLAVLKNIEKNTSKTAATFDGKSYNIGVD